MRISDWSSDVCSSDLRDGCETHAARGDRDDADLYRPASPRRRARGADRPSGGRAALDGRPCHRRVAPVDRQARAAIDAQRSEEHTSELQSLMRISYAVFCLKKKNTKIHNHKNI